MKEWRQLLDFVFCYVVWSPGQRIGLTPLDSGAKVDDEVVFRQLLGSAGLPPIIHFCLCEPQQVMVIRVNRDLLSQYLEQVTVVLQRIDNGQHFLVIDVVIQFSGVELSAVKCNRVHLPSGV